MARKTWLATAIAWCVGCCSSLAAEPIGQIKTETGEPIIVREGKASPIVIGDHVYQSDTINTFGGTVGITFIDNSMMSIGPNSVLSLDQFHYDLKTYVGKFEASLHKGKLVVTSGHIVSQTPEAMHVRTPTSSLGVRGTTFAVDTGD